MKNLNEDENNYFRLDFEALGAVFSLKKLQHYILCQLFKLYNDHQALKYFINLRDSHGRIGRSMSLFAEFDFGVVYRLRDKKPTLIFCLVPLRMKLY